MSKGNRGYEYDRLICSRCGQEFASNQWFRHGVGKCKMSELAKTREERDELIAAISDLSKSAWSGTEGMVVPFGVWSELIAPLLVKPRR